MTQRKKEENGLTAWKKVQYRISQIEQKLHQFNNKTPEPGSPEYKQWQALGMEYINELDKQSRLLQPLDNLEKLKKFIEVKISFLKESRRVLRNLGRPDDYPVDLPDWIEDDCNMVCDAVTQLFKETIVTPSQLTLSRPLTLPKLLEWFEFLKRCIDAEKKPFYKLKTFWVIVLGALSLITYLLNISDSGTFRSIISYFNQQFSHSQSASAPNAQTESNDVTLPSKTNHYMPNSLPDLNLLPPESPNQ